MRIIKFRGKRAKGECVGEWAYGELTQHDNLIWLEECEYFSGAYVQPDTIGQFTGLYDKNGKEIYEGDVFSVDGKYPKVVKYIEEWLSFCVANIDTLTTPPMSSWPEKSIYMQLSSDWWKDFQNEIEVIGNVHENPELITTKRL